MSISGRYYKDFKRIFLKYYKDIFDIGGKAPSLPFGWWGISLLLVGRAPHCHLVGRTSHWHIMLLECYKDGITIIDEHIIRIP